MKKLKLNVDKDAIRTFFLEHVEKIIFGVVVVCFLVMVIKARGREPYQKTEADLKKAAADARRHWENETNKTPKVEAFDYAEIVDRIVDIPIDESAYAHKKPWTPTVRDTRGARGFPELMPVAELRGTAGHGAVLVKEKSGRITRRDVRRGLRWIVITGLVPAEAQMAAFEAYYSQRKQHNPRTDLAQYVTYQVERAEVADPSLPADQLQWIAALPTTNGEMSLVERAKIYKDRIMRPRGAPPGAKGGAGEIVPDVFVDEVLTFPLIPLVDQPWDLQAVSHPKLMLSDDTAAGALEGKLEGEVNGGTEPVGVGMGDSGGFGGVAPDTHPAEGEEQPAVAREKLFRFFDFDVQPGKRYRYRVRLVLKNPNCGVEEKFLDPRADLSCLVPESTIEPGEVRLDTCMLIATPWSAASDVISVPHDTQLLALSVAQPLRAGGEPSGRMMVVKWVNQEGIEAYKEFGVQRGGLANIPEQRFPETVKKDDDKDDGRPRVRRKTDEPEPIKVDYITEAVVLDFRGGEVLPGRGNQSAPGQILVMDKDGNLTVHDELRDLTVVERVKGIESGGQSTTAPSGPDGVLPVLPPAEGGGLDLLEGRL